MRGKSRLKRVIKNQEIYPFFANKEKQTRGIPFNRTTINLKLYRTYFLYDFFSVTKKKSISFRFLP